MKKLLTFILAAAICLGSLPFTGCGESSTKIDESMSQLNVGIFDAGLGTTWLEEAARDFEAMYKETSFEDGKKGVQVIIDGKKEEFRPGNLIQTMPDYDNAIYFLDQGTYFEYINKGLISDITETVKEKVFDDNGDLASVTGKPATKSIEDTMMSGYKEYFNTDGKYYGIPYYYAIPGIIYDADLFNEKGFYMYKNGSFGATWEDIESGNCSTGPDGVLGTSDDGLPNTWNDFVRMMTEMRNAGVTPFTWSGAYTYQRAGVYNQIWANYEGANNFALNYSFSGHDTGLNLDITQSNAKQLVNQEGRKAGIKAFYDIASNEKNYSSKALTQNHTEAEFEYVWSVKTNNQIAMFMESGYWESEARDVFNEMALENAEYGYGKRNFRMMPMPNFTDVDGVKDQTNTARCFNGRSGDGCFVVLSEKNQCANKELQSQLAKLFLKFVQSREQLVKFTKNTGACFRCFNFSITEEEKATYTKYGQSVKTFLDEGAQVVFNVSVAEVRKKNLTLFDESNNAWGFVARRGTDTRCYDPFSYFYKYKGATVDDCYNDLKTTFEGYFSF